MSWPSPDVLDDLRAWGAGLGLPTARAELFHSRAWSAVLRLDGSPPVWLKACGPGGRYEAGVARVLRDAAVPGCLWPREVDEARGFLLLPDAGAPLRAVLDADWDLRWWERILGEHAEAQRVLSDHVDALLQAGTPDLRPERLPALLEEQLQHPPSGLSRAAAARIVVQLPSYARVCADLAAGGVRASLDHSDLHDGNVLVQHDRALVTDWGDSSVAHPFTVLHVMLNALVDRHGVDDATQTRLVDCYLEPWTAEHDLPHLRELVRLARRTAPLSRCLAWQRALVAASEEQRAPDQDNAGEWLEELLD